MKRSWIRLYTEVPHDPKAQRLQPALFKFWINCLCLAGGNSGVLPPVDEIAWVLRMNDQQVIDQLSKLEDAKFLERSESSFVPHGWDKRQYQTDLSTERVKRFRERSTKQSDERFEKQDVSVSRNGFSSVSVSASVSDSVSASAPEGGQGGNWPETLAAVREPFPDADEIIAERIVLEALRAKSTADDAEIAAAVRATYKRRVQKSPGLWLQTVPAFLKNGAPKSREYHQPACLICQDSGRVLRPGVTEKPGWVELPEGELYVSCECQRGAKGMTA